MTDAAVVFDDTVGDLIDEVEGLLMQVQSQRGAQRESTLKSAGDLLRDCKKKWHSLKVEVRGLPNSEKPRFDKKVKQHNDKLTELNQTLQKLKSEDLSQRGGVSFSESAKQHDDGKQEIRNIHARTTEHQKKSLKSLETTEALLQDTEKVAQDTTTELARQGEVIRNIDERLDELGDDITRAKRELNAFVRRMATDKLILCFLFLLVAGIVVAIILHFVLKSDDNNNAPTAQ